MTVRNNRIVHIEEHTPSHERRFIGWSDDPWTPEQMAAAIRQHPQQRVFWRRLLEPSNAPTDQGVGRSDQASEPPSR